LEHFWIEFKKNNLNNGHIWNEWTVSLMIFLQVYSFFKNDNMHIFIE